MQRCCDIVTVDHQSFDPISSSFNFSDQTWHFVPIFRVVHRLCSGNIHCRHSLSIDVWCLAMWCFHFSFTVEWRQSYALIILEFQCFQFSLNHEFRWYKRHLFRFQVESLVSSWMQNLVSEWYKRIHSNTLGTVSYTHLTLPTTWPV